MALKNVEETLIDRIQRALTKELKRLRARRRAAANGKSTSHVLARRAEAMATDSAMKQMDGGGNA